MQHKQIKSASFAAIQENTHGHNAQNNVKSATEEELVVATAVPHASIVNESKIQSESNTSIKSIMHSPPRTKEQIDSVGI